MALTLATRLIDRIIAEAKRDPGREVCGLLLGRGDLIEAILPVANVAGDPTMRFELDPAALIAAHRAARNSGPAILGHYHSHPNGRAEPSACDAEMAVADGSIWIVVACGALTAWRAVEAGALHGRFDPMPILRSG